jgi:hypothetical protein
LIKENTKVVIWCLIEISSALIACCLPVLRPVFADTWLSRLLCKLQDRLSPEDPSPKRSDRELEEGMMALCTIGGTDCQLNSKRESTWKDSKMSTNIDPCEVDTVPGTDNPTREIHLTFREIDISKEISVEQP